MIIDEAIEIEQGQYLHRNSPTYTAINLLSICILAFVFRNDAPILPLMLWVVGNGLLALYRIELWRRFRGEDFTATVARQWLRKMLVGPALASALWGAAIILIVPKLQPGQQYVFLYTFVLYTVTAVFNYSAYFPTFLCIFLPFGVTVVAAIAAGVTTFHPLIAGMLCLFVLAVPTVAWRFNCIFLHSLTLRFENLELVQQLRTQKETAEAANLAKSRFLAAASHDLRQPMHAINLYLGTLAGFDFPRQARELLGKARQCGQTMDEMFRALLDMSRLDAATVQPEITTFSVAAVLARIQVQFEPEARAKGLRLNVVRCTEFVRSDLTMVETILRNLVANAIRYTECGKILIGCRRRGSRLRLCVYDTGIGIPVDKQRAVFEEFYQLGNPERDRTKGLGLGLAIVERLAKLLASPIEVISNVGRGSLFAIDLPRGNPQLFHVAQSISPKISEHAQLTGTLVAVIDDEEQILEATRALLEQWGCRVVTALSARYAIAALIAEGPPDVIICDYRLRGSEDGIKVINAIRTEFNREIPSVLITGDTAPGRIREIQASDMPVLYKPIEGEALKIVLLEIIGATKEDRAAKDLPDESRTSPYDAPHALPAYGYSHPVHEK